jgi:hypothetical protein
MSLFSRIQQVLLNNVTFNPEAVAQGFNHLLRNNHLVTCTFDDIINCNINKKERRKQLVIILVLIFYAIPRYTFFLFLYIQKEETRTFHQLRFGDYAEQFGIIGRVFNAAYAIAPLGAVINLIVMRNLERASHLDFITDWKDYQDELLLRSLYFKMLIANLLMRTAVTSSQIYDLIACGLFIYSLDSVFSLMAFVALINAVVIHFAISWTGGTWYSLYLSFVMVADKCNFRIQRLIFKMSGKHSPFEILEDYSNLVVLMEKYNKGLKPLLRLLVYFYAVILCLCFLIFTLEATSSIIYLFFLIAASASCLFLATGLYIGKTHSSISHIYLETNTYFARIVRSEKQASVKVLIQLKTMIKELGSGQVDGQFVLALRNGEGTVMSHLKMCKLTAIAVSNTLLIIAFAKY